MAFRHLSVFAKLACILAVTLLLSAGLCGVGALAPRGVGDYFNIFSFLGFLGIVGSCLGAAMMILVLLVKLLIEAFLPSKKPPSIVPPEDPQ